MQTIGHRTLTAWFCGDAGSSEITLQPQATTAGTGTGIGTGGAGVFCVTWGRAVKHDA